MALGRKGLTSGAIKGLTVHLVWLTVRCVCVLLCKHAAVQSHTKQHAGADRGGICIVSVLPCQCSSVIAGWRRGISGQDPVINICSHQWR
ncbi:unnamed protein product, partial [Staurois parvus]